MDYRVKGEQRAQKVAKRRRAMPVNGKSVFVIQATIVKKAQKRGTDR
jgi:hypothetical protein